VTKKTLDASRLEASVIVISQRAREWFQSLIVIIIVTFAMVILVFIIEGIIRLIKRISSNPSHHVHHQHHQHHQQHHSAMSYCQWQYLFGTAIVVATLLLLTLIGS
jgi:UDP-N-acetylmuramyl pentapeptide phosphotransferase/UDP-N-acetylglucosamine-1-phosphate transferase